MRKHLLFTFAVLLFSCSLFAQSTITWDGGGATTDWDDMLNWDGDIVPTAADIVVFNSNETVTGTAPAAPVQLRLTNGAQVVFDLDLSVGDGVTAGNVIDLQTGARFVIENGRTFSLTPEANSNGLHIGSGADNVNVNIKGTAILNIMGGKHGINVANATASLIQRGTTTITDATGNGVRHTAGEFINLGGLTITGAASNGIDNAATFTNQSSSTTVITIDDAGNNGIKNKIGGIFTNQKDITIDNTSGVTTDGVCSEGSWTNEASSTIVVTGMEDDGVEVSGGTMDNDGSIDVTLKGSASAGNGGVVIGTSTVAATMNNTSNNSITVNGGASSGRDIIVESMGILNNTGTITLSGGDDGARIFNAGTYTNDLKGTLDLTDGRVNNSGTLTNNGLIISTRGGSGIFSTGTANNNAFFNYTGSNGFANGSGTENDLGISLNQFSARVLDLNGGNEVDIAEVSYVWTYSGAPVGTSDATGFLTVNCEVLDNDTISIRPEGLDLGSLPIRLRGVCNPALPVELIALEAISMPKSIMVKWRTATETDNDYIAVERSALGTNFIEIGRVTGNGDHNAATDYEIEDPEPVAGTNYYRLRQVDLDGTINYSHVVSADYSGADAGAMNVFPTVVAAGSALNVDLRESTAASLILMDAQGRQLGAYQLEGGAIASLPIAAHRPGMYYLRNSRNGATTRFIIK